MRLLFDGVLWSIDYPATVIITHVRDFDAICPVQSQHASIQHLFDHFHPISLPAGHLFPCHWPVTFGQEDRLILDQGHTIIRLI